MLENLIARRDMLITWINEYRVKMNSGQALTATEQREYDHLMMYLAEVILYIAMETDD